MFYVVFRFRHIFRMGLQKAVKFFFPHFLPFINWFCTFFFLCPDGQRFRTKKQKKMNKNMKFILQRIRNIFKRSLADIIIRCTWNLRSHAKNITHEWENERKMLFFGAGTCFEDRRFPARNWVVSNCLKKSNSSIWFLLMSSSNSHTYFVCFVR